MSGWPSSFSVVSKAEAAITVAVAGVVAAIVAGLAVTAAERAHRSWVCRTS